MGSSDIRQALESFVSVKSSKLRAYAPLYVMLLPPLVYYAVFHYAPMYGLLIAFKDYHFTKGIIGSPWVGVKHFRALLTLPSFFEVFRNTLIISFLKLAFGFPAPILLALLINEMRTKKLKKTVQTISYLPHFLSWVVLAGVFIPFLSPVGGPANRLLGAFGLGPIYFLGSEVWFRPTLVLTSVWKGVGWGSIIYLAALSGIDPALYEAADLDGASRWNKMRHITIPLLMSVVVLLFILAVSGLIDDDFDQIFNLYNPAVYSVGDVISTYVYRRGLLDLNYSFATAVGMFKNVLGFMLILVTNRIARRTSDYSLW